MRIYLTSGRHYGKHMKFFFDKCFNGFVVSNFSIQNANNSFLWTFHSRLKIKQHRKMPEAEFRKAVAMLSIWFSSTNSFHPGIPMYKKMTGALPTPQRKITRAADWLKKEKNWVLIRKISYWLTKYIHLNKQLTFFKANILYKKIKWHHRVLLIIQKPIYWIGNLWNKWQREHLILYKYKLNNRGTRKF